LRAVDSSVLEVYCVGYSRWVQAERDIAHNGTVIPYVIHNRDGSTQTKLVKNPALSVSSDAQKQMLRAGSLLGFNPVDRSRVTAPPKRNSNPFADLDDDE
jgi:P27 family predicted phage terminase small subunit